MKGSSALTAAALAAALLCAAGTSSAQDYPAKPVRVIVPFPPGGGTDRVARLVMPKLTERMGANFQVENRSGAGGSLGTEFVARAPADGYVLAVVNVSHAVNPGLYAKLAYDAARDFSPISLIAFAPGVLVVHPTLKVTTVKALIGMAKARPGKLHYASAGNGTPPHLAAELFASLAGVRMTHVPYKGSTAAFTDLVAGQIPVSFPAIATALPLLRTERLRALAVTGTRRSAVLPEVPTIAESGVRGYDAALWYGLIAPARTPAAVIEKLHAEIARAVGLPELKDRWTDQAMDPVGNSPAEFALHIGTEIAKWRKVIAAAGAKVE